MNAEQIELMKAAARTLLAHRDAGRHCDPEGIRWAEQLLAQNVEPKVESKTDSEETRT